MEVYNNYGKMKTARLKKANWQKLLEGSDFIIYGHKKRKYLTINYNKKTHIIYFKDQKKNKITSQMMLIKWE